MTKNITYPHTRVVIKDLRWESSFEINELNLLFFHCYFLFLFNGELETRVLKAGILLLTSKSISQNGIIVNQQREERKLLVDLCLSTNFMLNWSNLFFMKTNTIGSLLSDCSFISPVFFHLFYQRTLWLLRNNIHKKAKLSCDPQEFNRRHWHLDGFWTVLTYPLERTSAVHCCCSPFLWRRNCI